MASAHPNSPARGDATPGTCDGKPLTHHLHRSRVLFADAYALERWDAGPKRSSIRAAKQHKLCIRVENTRDAIGEYRQRLVRRFDRYRDEQLAVASVTPFDCGVHGHAAVPCYIVECESHFDWGAVNPSSGAFGWYQLLPSTYAGVCERCDRSQADQHLAASRVYARSGGSEWVCA